MRTGKLSLASTLLFWSAVLSAADSNTDRSENPATTIKHIKVVQTTTPPVIDGKLDDAVWRDAAIVRDLYQIRPGNGAPAFEPTEVYFLLDKDVLYVAARMWDSQPHRISGTVMDPDVSFGQEDRIAVVLDPFNTGRQGYRFETNVNGVRNDLLYQNNRTQTSWAVIWEASATRLEDGWSAEMAIPFKSLPFDPSITTWGLNISRAVRYRGEETAWVSRNRTYNPSIVGQASGFENLDAGVGLDVVPSLVYQQQKSYITGASDNSLEPSLDAYYRITSALTGSLTINTDFSGTEVDDRQVNLTRFSLFFPEKRDFFLNDADLFEFGRIGEAGYISDSRSTARSEKENARPFFSRSLGLNATGMPVDLLYGGKLSGRAGPFNIGTLAIRQDESVDRNGARIDAGNAFVTRGSANVLNESSIGFIATSGNLKSNLGNHLVGADFLYSNTRFAGNQTLEAEAWFQQSTTEGMEGHDIAYGLGARLPNPAGWRGGVSLREVQKNFFPALGFANRTDIRAYYGDAGYTKIASGGTLQSIYSGADVQRVTSLETGAVQSQIISLRPLELETRSRDSLKLVYALNTENITQPYEVYGDNTRAVIIPVGRYEFEDYGVEISTANQRRLHGEVKMRKGEFYAGEKLNIGGEVIFKASRHLALKFAHDWNKVTLPEGRFTTRLSRAGTQVYFSTRLSWVSLLQYDNVSELFGIHSRLSWVPKAGQEYRLVLNKSYQDFDKSNSFDAATQDLNAKASYTFRF